MQEDPRREHVADSEQAAPVRQGSLFEAQGDSPVSPRSEATDRPKGPPSTGALHKGLALTDSMVVESFGQTLNVAFETTLVNIPFTFSAQGSGRRGRGRRGKGVVFRLNRMLERGKGVSLLLSQKLLVGT
ncbi:hypothetical protein Salat_1113600 [Sesamum alatum]|uniref:Uncharacterized protein n=1 Tax=Sesamum alatum TaxID=300844 RepID=A0AAE1YPQ8_9LAMI|nr:hypothetical protein Salat_1113600 [Sesamum alatum]